jgi:hypothetical protein
MGKAIFIVSTFFLACSLSVHAGRHEDLMHVQQNVEMLRGCIQKLDGYHLEQGFKSNEAVSNISGLEQFGPLCQSLSKIEDLFKHENMRFNMHFNINLFEFKLYEFRNRLDSFVDFFIDDILIPEVEYVSKETITCDVSPDVTIDKLLFINVMLLPKLFPQKHTYNFL